MISRLTSKYNAPLNKACMHAHCYNTGVALTFDPPACMGYINIGPCVQRSHALLKKGCCHNTLRGVRTPV